MLTDKEFRHYQELYNNDPVVQRLCKMEYKDEIDPDLEERVADLEQEVDDLHYENEGLTDRVYELERENAKLEEKIAMWKTLESNNDTL